MMESRDERWQRIVARLEAYADFAERHGYGHLLQDRERLMYSATRDVNGVRVGIAGLNSAWSCCRKVEYGKLRMACRWQACRLAEELGDAQLTIALLHHPAECFAKDDRKVAWRDHLKYRFNWCLYGHGHHQNWVEEEPHSGNTTVGAGAAYPGGNGTPGYNVVVVDVESEDAEIWLRVYDESGPGAWVPDPSALTDLRGVWPVKQPRRVAGRL